MSDSKTEDPVVAVDAIEEEEEEELSVPALLEEAKRNYALKKWDQAADGYGRALEALSEERDDNDPIFAPLHHRYGHALLEHAITTSGALGGGGGGKDAPMPSRAGGATTVASARAQDGKKGGAAASSSSNGVGGAVAAAAAASKPSDPRFTFGGDAEEDSDEEEDAPQADGGEEEGDDLGDAFSVLELARVQYEKLVEQNGSLTTLDGEEWNTLLLKGQLAEVLNDLADVGLESENFQQASSDYQSALDLLEPLLQPHSRRLADAFLRLGLALEFHPDANKQASAEKYVTAALLVLRKRLHALEERQTTLQRDRESGGEAGVAQSNEAAAELRAQKAEHESAERLRQEGVLSSSRNGKGKEVENASTTLEKDDVASMDWQAIEKETKDIKEMIRDLELKLEEYANAPPGTESAAGGEALGKADAKAALQQAINEALLGASTNAISSGGSSGSTSTTAFGTRTTDPNMTINDLSAMVKKKKRVAPSEGASSTSAAVESKKARVDEEEEEAV